MKTPKHARGLPRKILFGHLESVPTERVSVKFLEENVWWWRQPDYKLQMWIADSVEGWPDCELRKYLPERAISLSREAAEDMACRVIAPVLRERPELQKEIDLLWADNAGVAHAYEWEARQRGRYPKGVPYCLLTRAHRRPWIKKYWRLNLNSLPAVWKSGNPEIDFDSEKWTTEFRFNLRHGDEHLIREFKKMLAQERERLKLPKPKHGGKDRRPLDRSWADIESIDIRTHSIEKTTSRNRQRESVTRRKMKPTTLAEREAWKLTISNP